MKLRLKPQHHADVREVERVLRSVQVHDADLIGRFPRPLKPLISLGSEFVKVCFESVTGLSTRAIVRTLREKYGVTAQSLAEDDREPLAGFLYATGTRAFIFSDSKYGVGFERFTIAHEAGHLFREFVPLVAKARQTSLFGATSAPLVLAQRDTPGQLALALDASTEDEASLRAEYRRRMHNPEALREKKADGFAAELLAPFEEVRRLVSGSPDRDRAYYVGLFQERFNISKKAASVRLAELSEEPDPDQSLLEYSS